MAAFASTDIAHQILSRLDAPTLAIASCVSSAFHSISADEKLWRRACSSQWPSSMEDPHALRIVSRVGGYRAFYSMCYPLVLHSPTSQRPVDCLQELSATDLVFMVDVAFNGQPVLSRVMEGISPQAQEGCAWFWRCPFRVEVEDGWRGHGLVAMAIGPTQSEKVWNALWENVRVSWILVSRETRQMVNLASFRPLGGRRQWADHSTFVLTFGSILPAHSISPWQCVRCNIVMKAKLWSGGGGGGGEQAGTVVRVSELSLELQGLDGRHLNGEDSVVVLKEALGWRRSSNHEQALKSHHHYSMLQTAMKEKHHRQECRVQSVSIICWIVAFISLCNLLLNVGRD